MRLAGKKRSSLRRSRELRAGVPARPVTRLRRGTPWWLRRYYGLGLGSPTEFRRFDVFRGVLVRDRTDVDVMSNGTQVWLILVGWTRFACAVVLADVEQTWRNEPGDRRGRRTVASRSTCERGSSAVPARAGQDVVSGLGSWARASCLHIRLRGDRAVRTHTPAVGRRAVW